MAEELSIEAIHAQFGEEIAHALIPGIDLAELILLGGVVDEIVWTYYVRLMTAADIATQESRANEIEVVEGDGIPYADVDPAFTHRRHPSVQLIQSIDTRRDDNGMYVPITQRR